MNKILVFSLFFCISSLNFSSSNKFTVIDTRKSSNQQNKLCLVFNPSLYEGEKSTRVSNAIVDETFSTQPKSVYYSSYDTIPVTIVYDDNPHVTVTAQDAQKALQRLARADRYGELSVRWKICSIHLVLQPNNRVTVFVGSDDSDNGKFFSM